MGTPGAGTPTAQKTYKGRWKYMVWLYKGAKINSPDANAGWNTYVIFDRDTGIVVEVVTWLTNPAKAPISKLTLPGQITLGSSMMDLVNNYGQAPLFGQVGNQIICGYPDRNITFSLDVASRRVVGIAIGKKSYTVMFTKRDTKTDNKPAGPRPGTLPNGKPAAPIAPNGRPITSPVPPPPGLAPYSGGTR